MTSAIQPITGRFQRRIVRDIVLSLSFGTAIASAFYYSHTRPKLQKFKDYDRKIKQETTQEAQEWFKENNYSYDK
jgi:hypothetical protein